MTAKEMFENLGYIECENADSSTKYPQIEYAKSYEEDITFIIDEHKIYISNYHITLDLLKAINKQVEELGWI